MKLPPEGLSRPRELKEPRQGSWSQSCRPQQTLLLSGITTQYLGDYPDPAWGLSLLSRKMVSGSSSQACSDHTSFWQVERARGAVQSPLSQALPGWGTPCLDTPSNPGGFHMPRQGAVPRAPRL